MQKKLTITVDEEVYDGLHRIVGPGKISRFVEDLVRPHLALSALDDGYARMAADAGREREAMAWAETTFRDICDDEG